MNLSTLGLLSLLAVPSLSQQGEAPYLRKEGHSINKNRIYEPTDFRSFQNISDIYEKYPELPNIKEECEEDAVNIGNQFAASEWPGISEAILKVSYCTGLTHCDKIKTECEADNGYYEGNNEKGKCTVSED